MQAVTESPELVGNSVDPSGSESSSKPVNPAAVLDNSVDPAGSESSSKPIKTANVVKETLRMDLHRNEIRPEDIINGYKFGGKYIPCTGKLIENRRIFDMICKIKRFY